MQSWKTFMVVALVFGGASSAAVGGCATDVAGVTDEDTGAPAQDSATPPKDSATPPKDSAAPDTAPPPTDSAPPRDTSPADTSPADTSTADARDAADADTGFDAGIIGPKPTGSPCAPVNSTFESTCGFCGKSTQLCEAAGGGTWSAPGACVGENTSPDRCTPGTPPTQETCGLCGRRNVVCQPNCTKAQGQCLGEVAGGCSPGTQEFAPIGCPTPGEGRDRTCDATCMWGAYSACHPPFTTIEIATTVGGTRGITLKFEAARTLPKLDTAFGGSKVCPATISATATMYAYGKVINNTAMNATVAIWGEVPGAAATTKDTIMAVYAGATEPVTPAERMACVGGVNDTCTPQAGAPAAMCASDNAGLVGAESVAIAAGATVTVYLAAYSSFATAGDIRINATTNALVP